MNCDLRPRPSQWQTRDCVWCVRPILCLVKRVRIIPVCMCSVGRTHLVKRISFLFGLDRLRGMRRSFLSKPTSQLWIHLLSSFYLSLIFSRSSSPTAQLYHRDLPSPPLHAGLSVALPSPSPLPAPQPHLAARASALPAGRASPRGGCLWRSSLPPIAPLLPPYGCASSLHADRVPLLSPANHASARSPPPTRRSPAAPKAGACPLLDHVTQSGSLPANQPRHLPPSSFLHTLKPTKKAEDNGMEMGWNNPLDWEELFRPGSKGYFPSWI